MILKEDCTTMNSEEIKADYMSTLGDLTCNSKPLINMMTIVAEENLAHAADIVAAIEERLAKVNNDIKLPILYLIDCICKNIGRKYVELFSQNIVSTFCSVFKVVDEKTRAEMFKLRQTWNDIFPQKKLYAIDVQIRLLDPAWPVTAQPPSSSIHFNPKFLKSTSKAAAAAVEAPPSVPNVAAANLDTDTYRMQQKLIQKQKELIELQQKKLELELFRTKVKLQQQMNNAPAAANIPVGQNVLLKPEVAKQLLPGVVTKNRAASLAKAGSTRIAPANSALISAASSRPIRDPRLLRQQAAAEKQNNGTSTASSSSSVPTKTSIVNNKVEPHPRLVLNNKDTIVSPPPSTTHLKPPQQSNITKTSPKSSTSRPSKQSRSKSSADVKIKSSVTDSPTKSKSAEQKSPSKSPNKRRKEHDATTAITTDKKHFKETNKSKSIVGKVETSPSGFKGVKSSKNRNYVRRNRSPSFSPELISHDVDFRLVAPPDKQPRLQTNLIEEAGKVGKDVDLRQFPVAAKRSSPDVHEGGSLAKKAKSDRFDALFGNEDTDLRTILPVAQPERPPTPPPPIISSALTDKDKDVVVTAVKRSANFEQIRAKLANATGRDKIMAQSFRKKPTASAGPPENPHKKIIISPDDEQCIKEGTMTKEQEKQLMNKIIAQIEQQKLKEAKLKESEETSPDDLQAVSDEELDFQEDDRIAAASASAPYPKYNRDSRETTRRGMTGGFWRGNKRRGHWENPRQPLVRPWAHHAPLNTWVPPSSFSRVGDESRKSPETSDLVVDSVNQDDIKTINIDGVPREIRYYDETAIVFMNWADPRQISFQNGTRKVSFDDESCMLNFNEDYKEIVIKGAAHRVRLGAPSREIFIDNKPYECYFGGPGITIDLGGGRMTMVTLDGPPPQVKIGDVKRTDLVAGKVNLIIDAKYLVPVFLDAKRQKFVLDGDTHTLQFVDALKTVLINDVRFKVEFGGLPKPITVHDKKHFIRFSVLPKGVKPGVICIKDMEGSGGVQQLFAMDTNEDSQEGSGLNDNYNDSSSMPERNSPQMFQNFMQQNNLEMLSSAMSIANPSSNDGYQVENLTNQKPSSTGAAPIPPNPQSTVPAPPLLNINELFQKLVATGIVATKEPPKQQPSLPPIAVEEVKPIKRNTMEHIRYISFKRPESLKQRQGALYDTLYAGMQCSSCGMRFPPEQTVLYSQHLDWHFRQNRRGKRNIRVASSRKWYYSLSDWKNYEEIEDLEEREKNYFEQAAQAEGVAEELEEEVEIPTVPADSDVQDPCCDVCQDKFDQFFNEEKEEWHLKNAVRVGDKTYHPVCFEDYQKSLLEPPASEEEKEADSGEKSDEIKIPGLEIILDDDDDEAEEQAEEPNLVVLEEEDEEEPTKDEDVPEKEEEHFDDGDDDDVIINEVVPEKIEVDDDREYLDTPPALKNPVKNEKMDDSLDDGFMDVEGVVQIKNGVGLVKIKSEPVDPDEIHIVDNMEDPSPILRDDTFFKEPPPPQQLNFEPSIDGNVEPNAQVALQPAPTLGANRIKINITKPILALPPKEPKDVPHETSVSLEPVLDPSQPLPPGEEPVQLNVKPALQGIALKKMPPVQKGSELTGMCSIM